MDDDNAGEVLDLDQDPIPGLGDMPEDATPAKGVLYPEPDEADSARGAGSTTVAPELVLSLAARWEKDCGYKSAKCSGVCGNEKHRRQGGYHIGRIFQNADNYSVVRPCDKTGPGDAASAIDMSMNPADMRLCTSRLLVVYNNVLDPRRKYINAFNGTLDGRSARRWDVYARKVGSATSDHLWHVHLELRRCCVNSAVAVAAVLSVLMGEPLAQYLAKVGGVLTGEPSTAPAFGGKVLQRAAKPVKNAAVLQVQQQLIKRGMISIGAADGYFGPKLESAVKVLQSSAALAVDGIIGPKTWPLPWTGRKKI